MPNLKFQTQVSGEIDGVHHIRSKPLTELVENFSFAGAVFYMITGSEPSESEEKVFNAILVASIDNGLSPASGFIPRVIASTGNDLLHSLAGGVMALGPYHGGAISGAAELISQAKNQDLSAVVENYLSQNKRIPGLGHPHYKHNDPRTDQLFSIAKDNHLSTENQTVMMQIQEEFYKQTGKHLVINIDGAIAALLLDLGFPPEAGNGLFALARVGGMIAHILEEKNEKPVRRIDESDIEFITPTGAKAELAVKQ